MPAIVVGAIISAVASTAAAKIGSNAAKGAAKTQSAATDRALAVQQQANQPYMQLGQQAMNYLNQGPRPVQPFAAGNGLAPGNARPPVSLGQGMSGAQPPMPVAGGQGPTMRPAPGGQSLGSVMQGGGGDQMVMLRAPDGSTKAVPQSQAQRYIAAGAQMVSGGGGENIVWGGRQAARA